MTPALSEYHRRSVQWGGGIGTHAYLLNLVGFNQNVLEIGCNTGYLSRIMQQRGCTVTGLEIDPLAAELARPFCQNLIVGDVENLDLERVLGNERFDVITFGDVLEHLCQPEAVLRRLGDYLTPDGRIVVSLPNIAHASIRLALLLGHFEYTSLGILDRTHLHFYTLQTAQELLASSGFSVDQVLVVKEPVAQGLIDQVLSHYPRLNPEWIQEMMSRQDAQAFQYVFQGTLLRDGGSVGGTVLADVTPTLSVVVQVGETGDLSKCLDALQVPVRQVVVVAASRPDEQLNALNIIWQPSRPNESRARLLNQAIAQTDGDVVLLLPVDHLLQPGSQTALLQRFRAKETGVLGGKVLNVGQSLILQAGAYLTPPIAEISVRAAGQSSQVEQWNDIVEVDFIPAAMALRRTLWSSLGGLDEGYGGYYFEADFCARVWSAGYQVLVDPQVLFVTGSPDPPHLAGLVQFHRDRLRFVQQRYARSDGIQGFFEAEAALLDQTESNLERQSLKLAYLWQLTSRPDSGWAETQIFLKLYERARNWATERLAPERRRLYLHRFQSFVPLIGSLIACLRAWWGGVAARWYVESLIHQQDKTNQVIFEQMHGSRQEIAELERLLLRLGLNFTERLALSDALSPTHNESVQE